MDLPTPPKMLRLVILVVFRDEPIASWGFPGGRSNESGQIIATSAEVTLNGGSVRESPPNPLNSGLGIILICPDEYPLTGLCLVMLENQQLFGFLSIGQLNLSKPYFGEGFSGRGVG